MFNNEVDLGNCKIVFPECEWYEEFLFGYPRVDHFVILVLTIQTYVLSLSCLKLVRTPLNF